jgi:diguanylate cyclase (GGDEF)-like protein/PAS domain S-box-containing protein
MPPSAGPSLYETGTQPTKSASSYLRINFVVQMSDKIVIRTVIAVSFMSPPFGRVDSTAEEGRLAALDRLGLSARPDPALDLLAGVVARQLSVPVVLVSLLNSQWEYFPGYAGPAGPLADSRKLPLTHSICLHVVDRQGPLVVSDTRLDPLVADNRAVADLGVIAYLGMPLIDLDDQYLGALCAVDLEPRAWTAAEIELMASLAVSCSHTLQRRDSHGDDNGTAAGSMEGVLARNLRAEHQLRHLVDTSPALLGYWDRELHNVIANEEYFEWFGKKPIEIVGRHLRDVIGDQHYHDNLPPIENVMRGESQTFYRTITDSHGQTRHTVTTYLPDRESDGRVGGFFEHGADVTELMQTLHFRDAVLAATPDLIFVRDLDAESIIWFSTSPAEHLGYSEEMLSAEEGELRRAQLPNRRLLSDRLGLALKRQSRTGVPLAVLYCDLDGFKRVNELGGHPAGDEVLQVVASRITALLRGEDTLARVGGDEFVIIIEPVSHHESSSNAHLSMQDIALAVAQRICDVVAEPISYQARLYHVSASVGIAIASAGEDPEEIIRNADAAMYRAKGMGKARAELYDRSVQAATDGFTRSESALRASLGPTRQRPAEGRSVPRTGAELAVYYQPVFDLANQQLVSVEALARLHDDNLVPISPEQFVPVAEETGLIRELGRAVLDIACHDLSRWHADYPNWGHLNLAVNVSARQGSDDLVDDVIGALERNGLAPEVLTLELTESVLLQADRSTMTALRTLRAKGVKIAIDDFGTGYASLTYLARLPVTAVKIDRSFTAGLPHDQVSATIVLAVRGLARDLRLDCIVEGIETDEQLLALPDGVFGQGYLLGRPMPAENLSELLAQRSAR